MELVDTCVGVLIGGLIVFVYYYITSDIVPKVDAPISTFNMIGVTTQTKNVLGIQSFAEGEQMKFVIRPGDKFIGSLHNNTNINYMITFAPKLE